MHPLSKAGKSYRGSKADNENPVADTSLAASLESLLLDWASHFVLSITLFCSAIFPPAPGVSDIQHSPRGFLSEVRALKVDRLLNAQTPHSWALPRSSSVPCSRLTCPVAPQLPLLNQFVIMRTPDRKILPIPHFPFTGKGCHSPVGVSGFTLLWQKKWKEKAGLPLAVAGISVLCSNGGMEQKLICLGQSGSRAS